MAQNPKQMIEAVDSEAVGTALTAFPKIAEQLERVAREARAFAVAAAPFLGLIDRVSAEIRREEDAP